MWVEDAESEEQDDVIEQLFQATDDDMESDDASRGRSKGKKKDKKRKTAKKSKKKPPHYILELV